MRTLRALCVIALLGAGQAASAKDGPCKLATKGDSPVAQACKEGGESKARALMKKMVAEANKRGMDVKCETCHDRFGDGRYDLLTKDGRAQFDKMLVVAKR
jgi:hypothetical protein